MLAKNAPNPVYKSNKKTDLILAATSGIDCFSFERSLRLTL